MSRNAFSALDMSDDDEEEVQLSNRIVDQNLVKKVLAAQASQTPTQLPTNQTVVSKVKSRSTRTVVDGHLVPREEEKRSPRE